MQEGKLEALWVYADDPTTKQYFTRVASVYGEALKDNSRMNDSKAARYARLSPTIDQSVSNREAFVSNL